LFEEVATRQQAASFLLCDKLTSLSLEALRAWLGDRAYLAPKQCWLLNRKRELQAMLFSFVSPLQTG
jgi:hypothetical protein